MEKLLRNSFMFLSKNKMLTKLAKKYGLKFGAARFVAGDTIERATKVIEDLNKQGLVVTLDFLGEFIEDEQEANEMADHSINWKTPITITVIIKVDFDGLRHIR
jgi:proline dehydrogenase